MSKAQGNHVSDLRGASRLAIDATSGLTGLVEAIHANIARTPTNAGNDFGQPPSEAKGQKPAASTTTKVVRARPVYPYPAVAKYKGSGDEASADSYVRGRPLHTEPTAAWAGQDFFKPYAPRKQ